MFSPLILIRTFLGNYRSSSWPGYALISTGGLHMVFGLCASIFRDPFLEAIQAGYVNKFIDTPARGRSFWFLAAGIQMILMGWTMHKFVTVSRTAGRKARTVALPRSIGFGLLIFAIPGMLAYKKSGFYLLLLQGVALILSK